MAALYVGRVERGAGRAKPVQIPPAAEWLRYLFPPAGSLRTPHEELQEAIEPFMEWRNGKRPISVAVHPACGVRQDETWRAARARAWVA